VEGVAIVRFRGAFGGTTGRGGIGAVAFGFNELLLALPIVPPITLFATRLVARSF
jgi:hypothetical protein